MIILRSARAGLGAFCVWPDKGAARDGAVHERSHTGYVREGCGRCRMKYILSHGRAWAMSDEIYTVSLLKGRVHVR